MRDLTPEIDWLSASVYLNVELNFYDPRNYVEI